MARRVTGPWNAAALPEIMAGAVQESKRESYPTRYEPVPFYEGRAAGQQPNDTAGARGSGTAEARARPNVEIRRAAQLYRAAPVWADGLPLRSEFETRWP